MSNLKRHFKRHHTEQYKSVELKDTELNKKSKLNHQLTSQKEISTYFPKTSKKATASISDEDIKNVSLQLECHDVFFKVMVLSCSMVTLLEVLESH